MSERDETADESEIASSKLNEESNEKRIDAELKKNLRTENDEKSEPAINLMLHNKEISIMRVTIIKLTSIRNPLAPLQMGGKPSGQRLSSNS